MVERVCADEPDLFLGSEEQFDAGVRSTLGQDHAGRLEHGGDSGLVVGAEDRAGAVSNDSVLDDRLDRRRRRHGVEVSAEQERLTGGGGLDPRVQVAHCRADPRPALVLVDVETAVV